MAVSILWGVRVLAGRFAARGAEPFWRARSSAHLRFWSLGRRLLAIVCLWPMSADSSMLGAWAVFA
eukprot:1395650-Lingulodinium_polyedra.AAC.1